MKTPSSHMKSFAPGNVCLILLRMAVLQEYHHCSQMTYALISHSVRIQSAILITHYLSNKLLMNGSEKKRSFLNVNIDMMNIIVQLKYKYQTYKALSTLS